MLNSAENEICPVYKYKKKKKKKNQFFCSTELSMKFFLLITTKMPAVIGILIVISRTNFMLS